MSIQGETYRRVCVSVCGDVRTGAPVSLLFFTESPLRNSLESLTRVL